MGKELTLYHCAGARSFRALWTLKELNLANYNLITMPFPPRARAREYLKVNPLGTVPFMKYGDVSMTESSGIPLYIAQTFAPDSSLLVKQSEAGYGMFLNFLFQSDATLTFPQTLCLRYEEFEPKRGLQEVSNDYRKWYLARLKIIDQILLENEYLVANRFTLADICVTYALWLGIRTNSAHLYKPQTKNYLERMSRRPAFVEAQAEETLSLQNFSPSNL